PEMNGDMPQMPSGEMPQMQSGVEMNFLQTNETPTKNAAAEIIKENNKAKENKPVPETDSYGTSLALTGISAAALVVAIAGVSFVKNKF
ncbi:MAG: hypothetical protein IJ305_03465, partial [Oscillospiraceae bacterium]|nr:hypothetical protein [Oscillospiraceae bacterium]